MTITTISTGLLTGLLWFVFVLTSLLWLTDRTRFKDGIARCARKRYLSNYAGPTGYGFVARRESLPLAGGITVHRILEDATHILTHDRLPTLAEARASISTRVAEYIARVDARGYRGILSGPQTEETIAEQAALIAGLGWVLHLKFLPWFHQTYQAIAVEQERLHFLECACGAPPLDAEEHVRRSCTGKALMIRTDLLARRRTGQGLAYFECKTTGWDSESWAEQWETDPQLALGTLDAEALWGGEVTELYVVALSKGSRKRDRYEDDGVRRQQSPLCYGYLRPGNPPLMPDDWLPSYEWVNEAGEVKRKSRAHRRTGVWQLQGSDWPVWLAYKGSDPQLTPSEFWVRQLPVSLVDRICHVIGPMNRQDQQLRSLLRSLQAEEGRWQDALWRLYELQQAGHVWPSAVFQSELDRLIPCSWACRPFGREHQCEFVPVCHRHVGWDDPMGSGQYQPRLPHHTPELQQAIARGLLPEQAEEPEEEE